MPLLIAASLPVSIAPGQAPASQHVIVPSSRPTQSAKSWATDAAAQEIEIINHSGSYIRYRQRVIEDKGDELRDVIESRDGSVGRLIMRDNRPLTPEEDQAERDRLLGLLDQPSAYARHVKNDASTKKLAIDTIKLMPSAMVYTYAADQTPIPECKAHQIVLDYEPNPAFDPPNATSVALTGLRGRIWIDADAKTIVRMTGEIFRPVNFGWGMLAHIYPGGQLELEQASAWGARWNMTRFHEDVTARALLVKSIAVKKEFHSLDFQPLPAAMSYQEAIHLLLDTPLPR